MIQSQSNTAKGTPNKTEEETEGTNCATGEYQIGGLIKLFIQIIDICKKENEKEGRIKYVPPFINNIPNVFDSTEQVKKYMEEIKNSNKWKYAELYLAKQLIKQQTLEKLLKWRKNNSKHYNKIHEEFITFLENQNKSLNRLRNLRTFDKDKNELLYYLADRDDICSYIQSYNYSKVSEEEFEKEKETYLNDCKILNLEESDFTNHLISKELKRNIEDKAIVMIKKLFGDTVQDTIYFKAFYNIMKDDNDTSKYCSVLKQWFKLNGLEWTKTDKKTKHDDTEDKKPKANRGGRKKKEQLSY